MASRVFRDTSLTPILSSTAILLIFLLAPSRSQHQRVVGFKSKMSILASRAEPPRIAFDQVLGWKPSATDDDQVQLLAIESSRKSVNLNDEIVTLQPSSKPMSDLLVKKLSLAPMSFSHEEALQQLSGQRWIGTLSIAERMRLQKANLLKSEVASDWQQPIWETQTANAAVGGTKRNISGQYFSAPSGSKKEDKASVTTVAGSGLFELTSKIQLDAGLPIGGDYHLIIRHYEDGVPKEIGTVDPVAGIYKIQVENFTGSLRAQIVHNQGHVLGEGSEKITYLANQPELNRKAPVILVRKSNNAISGQNRNFGSSPETFGKPPQSRETQPTANHFSPTYGSNAANTSATAFQFDRVRNGSRAIVESKSGGNYSSLKIITAGQNEPITFFTVGFIKALKALTKEARRASEYPETGSVIFGRVLVDGNPKAGAKVLVENFEKQKAIYFNDLIIPEFEYTTTDKNGYFAFLDLPEGLHSLRVEQAGSLIGFQNVAVTDNASTDIVIDCGGPLQSADLKVFDAFSGEAQSAEIKLQSQDQSILVEGLGTVLSPTLTRQVISNAKPIASEYMSAEYYYASGEDFVHFPLIKKSWFNKFQLEKNLQVVSGTSTIVGFVPDRDFKAYLPHENGFSKENIVYFDSTGEITTTGVAGGGFVIYNVPVGIQSVVIFDTNAEFFLSEVIQAKPNQTAILKF